MFCKNFSKILAQAAACSLMISGVAFSDGLVVPERDRDDDGIGSRRCQPANTCADWAGCLNEVVRVRPRIDKVWEVDFISSRGESYLMCEYLRNGRYDTERVLYKDRFGR
jgi:hypothetical protein